ILIVVGYSGCIRPPRQFPIMQLYPCANGLLGWPWDFLVLQPAPKGAWGYAEQLSAFSLGKAEAKKTLF
ncbi:MAG: hypothetical protein WA425_02790, partial [Xanthobacteraceae bacterium]